MGICDPWNPQWLLLNGVYSGILTECAQYTAVLRIRMTSTLFQRAQDFLDFIAKCIENHIALRIHFSSSAELEFKFVYITQDKQIQNETS